MKSIQEIALWPKGSKNEQGGDAGMPNGVPSLTLYPPPVHGELKKPRPCVLVCPGGGYAIRANHEGLPFAQIFGLHGMVSGVIHYRVSPNRFPAPYADAARAIRYVRANAESLGVDPDRIAIMGFSAGGHLAATVAIQPDLWLDPEDDLAGKVSARPDRVILGYPVISAACGHVGSFKNLLGEELSSDSETLKKFSNDLHVGKDSPPAFIFHTANDGTVPVKNVLNLASSYEDAKVPFEMHIFKDGPHGIGTALHVPKLRCWTDLMITWMQDWVRPPYGD